jgi:hypothetical protein
MMQYRFDGSLCQEHAKLVHSLFWHAGLPHRVGWRVIFGIGRGERLRAVKRFAEGSHTR